MKYLAAFALGSALAAPAFAGGMNTPVEEPVIAPVTYEPEAPNGDWSGAYGGVQLGYGDVDSNGAGLNGNGAIGGVHLGYRMDYGNFVGGVELDHDRSNIDLGAAAGDLDHVTRLKLQAGYDMGRTLIYGTGGLAHAKATVGGAGLSDNGWFLGAGVDYQVTDQWVVGGEVLQHRFTDFDGSGVRLDATTAKVKVSYRF